LSSFGPRTDELYGELGNDRLDGGDGDDILIGDIGHSLRRYSGTVPLTKSSGDVWHKDIVLEEQGNITSITRISQTVNTSIIDAESIAAASLLFVATGCANGTKANSSGVWPTDLFTYTLEQAYDDFLIGGSGNDILIGQRGNDKLYTGAGIQTYWCS
jgi:Ca2+-binding RTX toxin-like protein